MTSELDKQGFRHFSLIKVPLISLKSFKRQDVIFPVKQGSEAHVPTFIEIGTRMPEIDTRWKWGRLTSVIGPVVDLCGSLEDVSQRIGWSIFTRQYNGRSPLITWKILLTLCGNNGLRRGQTCTSSQGPISVSVGRCTLGRIFNMLGEPVDGMGVTSNKFDRRD